MRASPLFLVLLLNSGIWARAPQQPNQPVVVSAQSQAGAIVYRVNGRRVEDSKTNSLLTNLLKVADARGLDVPVLVLIDELAPFTEVGKLETALDKIGNE